MKKEEAVKSGPKSGCLGAHPLWVAKPRCLSVRFLSAKWHVSDLGKVFGQFLGSFEMIFRVI